MSELATPEVRLAEHADLLAISVPAQLPAEFAGISEFGLAAVATELIRRREYAKDDPSFGPYNAIAHELQRELVSRAIVHAMAADDSRLIDVALETVVFTGLQTISWIQSYAPNAYVQYAAGRKERPTLTAAALGAIVRKSRVVNYFARTENQRNILREVVCGLYPLEPPTVDDPFVIVDSRSGPKFDVSKAARRYAAQKVKEGIAKGHIDANPKPHRQCPAAGVVLKMQWQRATELCLERGLFAHDLATA